MVEGKAPQKKSTFAGLPGQQQQRTRVKSKKVKCERTALIKVLNLAILRVGQH